MEKFTGEVGNLLVRTILVDTSFKSSAFQTVARVLVELDISEAMVDCLDIVVGDSFFQGHGLPYCAFLAYQVPFVWAHHDRLFFTLC